MKILNLLDDTDNKEATAQKLVDVLCAILPDGKQYKNEGAVWKVMIPQLRILTSYGNFANLTPSELDQVSLWLCINEFVENW